MVRWKLNVVTEEHIAANFCCLLYVYFFLGLLFDPEDGGEMFLRYLGLISSAL
jgi:hypothetical protein